MKQGKPGLFAPTCAVFATVQALEFKQELGKQPGSGAEFSELAISDGFLN